MADNGKSTKVHMVNESEVRTFIVFMTRRVNKSAHVI